MCSGLHMSVVVATILATNKGARKHVVTRLRQQIDSFTIGGNNTVHPVVEIALVPLRSLVRPAPTLPTSTSAEPALVRFSNPLPRASGLENLTCSNTAKLNKSYAMPCRRIIVSKFTTTCKVTQKSECAFS